MSAKKLVVSTYLQYILIGLGALLLVVFVRQLSGVLMAAILAYVLNPLVGRVPRAVRVVGRDPARGGEQAPDKGAKV